MSTGRNRHLSDQHRMRYLADRRPWKHGGGLAPEPLCDARRVKPYVVADSNIGDGLSLDEIVDRRSPEMQELTQFRNCDGTVDSCYLIDQGSRGQPGVLRDGLTEVGVVMLNFDWCHWFDLYKTSRVLK